MNLKQKILLVGVTVLLLLMLTGCGENKVSLDKYIQISSSGYDSKGTATVSFDYSKFEDDYGKKIKLSKKEDRVKFSNKYSGELSKSDANLLIQACVKMELDKDSNLKNGDTINLKLYCDDELAEKYFGVKFIYSDIKYTVDNLENIDKFNPFDYIKVTFSGTSPNGKVNIEKDSSRKELSDISLIVDKTSHIKIGETVKISADYYTSEDDFVKKYGSIIETNDKEYICDSLDHYATKVEDIPEDKMAELKAHGESIFRAYVADRWSKPENLTSVVYEGNYFLTLKDGITGWDSNYLYLVYKIQATNPEPAETVDFYYYVGFENIIVLTDGTCSVDMNTYSTPESSWPRYSIFRVGDYTYVGYKELSELVNDCVTANGDRYNYTTTIMK